MNVNFEYYKIFYYVAKYENFTKAARVLGNSQPNITRAMNSLEQQIQESLVMMDNLAFIVNVKNNTVVTAMEQGESGQVFTNIDGAVIV